MNPDIYNFYALAQICGLSAIVIIGSWLLTFKAKYCLPIALIAVLYACSIPIANQLRQEHQDQINHSKVQEPE